MNDCAGSLQVEVMRVARLGPTGAPLAGAGNVYVTDALIELGADPQISEGTDHELKNGAGRICLSGKDPDQLKGLNMSIILCTPDPQLHNMLGGGEVILDGSDVVGWAAPRIGEDSAGDGVSIEAFTKAWVNGHQADELPWWEWVFPRTKWRVGAKTLANAPLQSPLTGTAEENENWYNGPANDWDYTSDAVYQYARVADAPTPTCQAAALVAS